MTKYLGSAKNLAGSAAGLVGVLLYLLGVVGGYWPVVVIGLYAVGALLAPPERVRLVPGDAFTEIEQLRTDLATISSTVERHGDRMPGPAADFVARITAVLTGMLDRPQALRADPDLLHSVIRLARVDVPLSIESYLNVPWWLARKERGAADELLAQLDLLEAESHRIAERFYRDDITQQADHTRYLRHRADQSGDG
ncbi:hypothetical protein [Kibdelosporangium phytohabitans]|uniref:Uncharacterized protein n=1 Tax=Kibdelosporangium phytohabitans TaxID=860235 RepID=A0A0N9HYT4_9PSEU|nr:hypothetical protein [Kibdelosporangium phytohabitans]ALG07414.1 hypothetical protein AOZ06_11215 [Kibdelosporangium phytohabitans]MBE1471698.1 hypothetical protein [Kibdelosporangium phytohabitans]